MHTTVQQIKEAHSTVRLAVAGVDNFGPSAKGAEAKPQMHKSEPDMQKVSLSNT